MRTQTGQQCVWFGSINHDFVANQFMYFCFFTLLNTTTHISIEITVDLLMTHCFKRNRLYVYFEKTQIFRLHTYFKSLVPTKKPRQRSDAKPPADPKDFIHLFVDSVPQLRTFLQCMVEVGLY